MATYAAPERDGWSLDVQVSRDERDVVVAVCGELDAATVPSLREVLLDLIDNQGNLGVVIDLADVSFIDSTGLGVIVGARKKLVDRGGHLRVRHPTAPTMRVLEITGLVKLLDIEVTA